MSNVLGALLQGVLPTMIILAIYYVVADFILLGQWFYYRGSGPSGRAADKGVIRRVPTEQSSLLGHETVDELDPSSGRGFVDVENLSDLSKPRGPSPAAAPYISSATTHAPMSTSSSTSSVSAFMVSAFYKLIIVVLVCLMGVLGWYVSSRSSHSQRGLSSLGIYASHPDPSQDEAPQLKLWGQVFGYICAAFYIGSRIPQFLLNQSRKSTEGVSILFFLFCCIGNITFVLSIFAYEPRCAGEEEIHHRRLPVTCENGDWERAYWRYILVDASWVAGASGALILDLAIFSQFWFYRGRKR